MLQYLHHLGYIHPKIVIETNISYNSNLYKTKIPLINSYINQPPFIDELFTGELTTLLIKGWVGLLISLVWVFNYNTVNAFKFFCFYREHRDTVDFLFEHFGFMEGLYKIKVLQILYGLYKGPSLPDEEGFFSKEGFKNILLDTVGDYLFIIYYWKISSFIYKIQMFHGSYPDFQL